MRLNLNLVYKLNIASCEFPVPANKNMTAKKALPKHTPGYRNCAFDHAYFQDMHLNFTVNILVVQSLYFAVCSQTP